MGTTKETITKAMNQNSHQLDILTVTDLIGIWEDATGKNFTIEFKKPEAKTVAETLRTGVNYVAPAMDTAVAYRLIRDVGASGKVVFKSVGSKTYVIFKGYAGTRSIFSGTRYLASNPQVVQMGIGKLGTDAAIKGGAKITVFLVVPINIVQHILSDESTMSQLVGKTATDLVKIGIASLLASAAAAAVGTVTAVAAGPLLAAIVVGVAAGFALDAIDNKFGLTDSLVQFIDKSATSIRETAAEAHDSTFGALARYLYRWERAYIDRAINQAMGRPW